MVCPSPHREKHLLTLRIIILMPSTASFGTLFTSNTFLFTSVTVWLYDDLAFTFVGRFPNFSGPQIQTLTLQNSWLFFCWSPTKELQALLKDTPLFTFAWHFVNGTYLLMEWNKQPFIAVWNKQRIYNKVVDLRWKWILNPPNISNQTLTLSCK